MQVGWLLTVANLGDSRAVVDSGAQVVLLTEDHRVASHRGERRRLEAAGSIIAPLDISGQDCPHFHRCQIEPPISHRPSSCLTASSVTP